MVGINLGGDYKQPPAGCLLQSEMLHHKFTETEEEESESATR